MKNILFVVFIFLISSGVTNAAEIKNQQQTLTTFTHNLNAAVKIEAKPVSSRPRLFHARPRMVIGPTVEKPAIKAVKKHSTTKKVLGIFSKPFVLIGKTLSTQPKTKIVTATVNEPSIEVVEVTATDSQITAGHIDPETTPLSNAESTDNTIAAATGEETTNKQRVPLIISDIICGNYNFPKTETMSWSLATTRSNAGYQGPHNAQSTGLKNTRTRYVEQKNLHRNLPNAAPKPPLNRTAAFTLTTQSRAIKLAPARKQDPAPQRRGNWRTKFVKGALVVGTIAITLIGLGVL